MIIHPKLISLINFETYQTYQLNLAASGVFVSQRRCEVYIKILCPSPPRSREDQCRANPGLDDRSLKGLFFVWEMYGKCMVNVWKSCAETPRTYEIWPRWFCFRDHPHARILSWIVRNQRNHSRESQIIVNQWIRQHSDMVVTWQTSRVLPSWSGCLKAKLQTDQGSGHSPELVDGRCWSMCHGHGNHMWSLVIVIQPGEPPKSLSHLRPHAEIGNDKEDQDTSPKALAPHRKELRHTRCSMVFITMSGKKKHGNCGKIALQHFHLIGNFHTGQTIHDSWSTLPATYPGFPLDTIGILSVTMAKYGPNRW